MNTTPILTADIADELVAGMSFPTRNALAPTTHASVVALLQARRAFWIAAADGYAAQAAAGCPESSRDAQAALAQAAIYAPRVA